MRGRRDECEVGVPVTHIDVQALVDANVHPWYNQTLTRVNDSVMRWGVIQGEYHWHKHEQDKRGRGYRAHRGLA
jgi:hypothetical protein